MKRITPFILVAICVLDVVSACKKPETDPTPDPSINIDSPSVLVPAGENTAVLTFTANNDWTVVSSESWCTVSPSSGKASENAAMVTITLDPNTTPDTRSAKITIKAGGIEKQITVTQAGEEVKPEDIVINYIWNSQDDTQITNRNVPAGYRGYWDNRVCNYVAYVTVDFPNPDLVITPESDAQGWIFQSDEVYYNDYDNTYSISFQVASNGEHEPRTGHLKITNRDGKYTSAVIKVEQVALPEHAVDLGLFTYWNEFNLGASAPEEPGNYYAWAETTPKELYDWSTYKWANGSENSLTKYEINSWGSTMSYDDDAAVATYGQGSRYEARWHIPSSEVYKELMETFEQTDLYKWEEVHINNHICLKITYLVNGNSIILPFAGMKDGTDTFVEHDTGFYWSSETVPNSPRAKFFRFNRSYYNGGMDVANTGERCLGMTIRPVTQ